MPFFINNLQSVLDRYNEPHRFYHNGAHLSYLTRRIYELIGTGRIDTLMSEKLLLAAYYHDAIYNPTRTDNELQSAELFLKEQAGCPHAQEIYDMIMSTENSWKGESILRNLDREILHGSWGELIAWEHAIFKEYQFCDYSVYRQKRVEVLNEIMPAGENKRFLVNYVQNRRINVGVYVGSFNPFHIGHLNVLQKAERIFDKVIIVRAINTDKKQEGLAPLSVPFREIREWNKLTTDLVFDLRMTQRSLYSNVTLIRGLRNYSDYSYEINLLRAMKDIDASIEVVMIPCDKEYEHISSSLIRGVAQFDEKLVKRYAI